MAVRLWEVIGTNEGGPFRWVVPAATAQEAISLASDGLATGKAEDVAEVTSVRLLAESTKEPK